MSTLILFLILSVLAGCTLIICIINPMNASDDTKATIVSGLFASFALIIGLGGIHMAPALSDGGMDLNCFAAGVKKVMHWLNYIFAAFTILTIFIKYGLYDEYDVVDECLYYKNTIVYKVRHYGVTIRTEDTLEEAMAYIAEKIEYKKLMAQKAEAERKAKSELDNRRRGKYTYSKDIIKAKDDIDSINAKLKS